jgi:ribonuclease HI
LPLDILFEKRASEIMARINNQIQPSWDGIGKGKKNGLIKRWRSASNKICNGITNTDKIPTKMVKERNYKVHPPDDGRINHKEAKGVISYTDGSVLNNKTGCGIHTVHGQRVIYNGNFYLGNTTTVFQAEVTAIKKSAEMLNNKKTENETITFFSDSQASLAALNKLTVKSDTVEKCLNALNALGKNNAVHLRWVKARVGIHGNEVADSLAKKGSSLGEGPTNELLTPQIKQKGEIKDHFYKKWAKAWNSYTEARQTKIWFPKPDVKKSSILLKMDRYNLSQMVQFLTGHNKLKRHKNIQDRVDNFYSCRLCEEDEESSFHVIAECPAMQTHRSKVFKTQGNRKLPYPPE